MDAIANGAERRDIQDRRRARTFRATDRRDGFDRRRRYPLLDVVRERPLAVPLLLIALNLFSLIDGFYTSVEVGLGVASEANPLLTAAAAQHPLLPALVKVGMMALVTAIIWTNRQRRDVLRLALAGVAIYGALVVYHRVMLVMLGLL